MMPWWILATIIVAIVVWLISRILSRSLGWLGSAASKDPEAVNYAGTLKALYWFACIAWFLSLVSKITAFLAVLYLALKFFKIF
jgi:hypothetical protein